MGRKVDKKLAKLMTENSVRADFLLNSAKKPLNQDEQKELAARGLIFSAVAWADADEKQRFVERYKAKFHSPK